MSQPLILRNPSFPSPAATLHSLGIRRRRLLAAMARAGSRCQTQRRAMLEAALRDVTQRILAAGAAA